jgi:antirestriction protein ArdC
MSEFRDVYTKITDRIVADLEQGVRPWMRPWSADVDGCLNPRESGARHLTA